MNREEQLAVRVGAVMLVVIAVAVAFVLVVDDVSVRRHVEVRVRLAHVGGLQEGADVHIAGRVVGEIASIELGDRDGVVLHTKIERRYAHMAPINGEWFVNSKGVFAERYLEVGPPADGAAPARPIRDGDELRGVDPARFDRLTTISMRNFDAMRELTRDLAPELDALSAALDETARLLDEIQPGPGRFARMYRTQVALVGEVEATTAFWRDSGVDSEQTTGLAARGAEILARARERLRELRQRLEALDAELSRIGDQVDPARFAQFERALDEGRDVLARLEAGLAVGQQLAEMVDRGQGTLGGFLHDHELRDFAKRLQRIIKRQGWDVVGHPSNRKLR